MAERHDVIAFDRPGHGLSGWPGATAAQLAEQARLLRGGLAELGVRRATIVGHSYGGSVALAWALDAPDSVDGLAADLGAEPGLARRARRCRPTCWPIR